MGVASRSSAQELPANRKIRAPSTPPPASRRASGAGQVCDAARGRKCGQPQSVHKCPPGPGTPEHFQRNCRILISRDIFLQEVKIVQANILDSEYLPVPIVQGVATEAYSRPQGTGPSESCR